MPVFLYPLISASPRFQQRTTTRPLVRLYFTALENKLLKTRSSLL